MTPNAHSIILKHQRLWLLPERAVFWQKKNMLLIADLHIGKSGHFRKNGIPVPHAVNQTNLDVLEELVQGINPRHLVLLGDLFHSQINNEWQQFTDWRKQHSPMQVSLVVGNHDILSNNHYHSSHINIFKRLTVDPFLFLHDVNQIKELENKSNYILCGHIHPAVRLKGKGRQQIKLPCFYFGKYHGILPAFGQFTGTHVIMPAQGDRIFALAEQKVISLTS